MVPQEEKVYVERSGEFFELGRRLPGQRVGSKAWYDHLGKVARDEGLQPKFANSAVFYKVGRTPLAMSSHVDDLQLVGSQQDVEKLLDSFRKQAWTLQVQGPCSPKVAGQCAFLKRQFASDGSGSMTVRMDQKYVKKLVDLLDLRVNKGKLTPTTGTFQKGLQGQPLSKEELSLYRTCVGILLYMSTERPDIQCAVRQLASKVTGPDTLDQKELKQLVLYLKHTADYVQEMKQSFAMASAMGERNDDVKMAATQRPSRLEVFTDSDWASDRTTRRSTSCSHMYLNGSTASSFGVRAEAKRA